MDKTRTSSPLVWSPYWVVINCDGHAIAGFEDKEPARAYCGLMNYSDKAGLSPYRVRPNDTDWREVIL